jgi:hypothetical protein
MELLGFKRLICEEIKEYAIEFQEKLTVLQEFLALNDEQTLILKNSHNPLFSSIKVYHTLNDMDDYKKFDSYIFLRHEMMKFYDVTKRVLEVFGSAQYSHILIVECSVNGDKVDEWILRSFCDILKKNEKKKLVLIFKSSVQLPLTSLNAKIFEDNKNNLTDLSTKSQQNICESTIITFQGHEVPLQELISENLRNLLVCEILLQILKKEKIEIGEKLPD